MGRRWNSWPRNESVSPDKSSFIHHSLWWGRQKEMVSCIDHYHCARWLLAHVNDLKHVATTSPTTHGWRVCHTEDLSQIFCPSTWPSAWTVNCDEKGQWLNYWHNWKWCYNEVLHNCCPWNQPNSIRKWMVSTLQGIYQANHTMNKQRLSKTYLKHGNDMDLAFFMLPLSQHQFLVN